MVLISHIISNTSMQVKIMYGRSEFEKMDLKINNKVLES